MRGDLWAYNPDVCDGDICWLDCDHCPKRDKALCLEDDKDE